MSICNQSPATRFITSQRGGGDHAFRVLPSLSSEVSPRPARGDDTQQVIGALVDALVRLLGAFYPYMLLAAAFVLILVLTLRATHHDEGVRQGARDMLRVITGRAFLSALGQLLHPGVVPVAEPSTDSPADVASGPFDPQTDQDTHLG